MEFILWRDYGYEGMQGDRFDTLAEAQAEYDQTMALPEKRRNSFGTPEIMLHPVPQCSACRHWQPLQNNPGFGFCNGITVTDTLDGAKKDAMYNLVLDDHVGDIVTGAEFGCLQFDTRIEPL